MGNETLNISYDYLKEVIGFSSSKCVGKIMKRFDLFESPEVLKKEIKELIYENYRDFLDIILAHNKGLDMDIFVFKGKKKLGEDSTYKG